MGVTPRLRTIEPFRARFKPKRDANCKFADWLRSASGETVDPDTVLDCKIKRIHEYNRQLLNALRIIVLYNRLREKSRSERANPNILLCRQSGAGPPPGKTDHQNSSTT
jgi:glucan phosphorylase